MKFYPMKLRPVPKNIIWGGNKLKNIYAKVAPFENIAESWELTVRDDGMSIIENGMYAGTSLGDFVKQFPDSIAMGSSEKFPLLIKFIDAANDLSVQVHPDDSYAAANENDGGKTEMWYVIDADEDAEIIYGVKNGVDEKILYDAIESGKYSNVLRRVKVKKGDVFFIPAGQIHALCRGILIAEIQQNSNLTYRIYDYDRRDAEGKKRELHLDKALDTVKCYSDEDIGNRQFSFVHCRRPANCGMEVIADCEYFRVSTLSSKKGAKIRFTVDESSFASLLFTDADNAEVSSGGQSWVVNKGDSYFIPAGTGEITVSGEFTALLSEL